MAQRAGVSRTTLYNIERGDASVTLGAYVRILAALGLDKDIDFVATGDPVGRRLQDAKSDPARARKRSS